jgi:uncharacterized cupin superfamily protein
MNRKPIAAVDVPASARKTIYPAPFAVRVEGRIKRRLGDHFGLKNFGINLTQLRPGAVSALMHHHSHQDEFIYVLAGQPTVLLGAEEHLLEPGDCFGFSAGSGLPHQLVNRTESLVSYLEVGDRSPSDHCVYTHDDLAFGNAPDGSVIMVRKDGTPW